MLYYPVGASGEVIQFETGVLDHFDQNRQLHFWHREAGGQLFARIVGHRIIVSEATGPRPEDKRGRTFFEPDRRSEQADIDAMFARDLHYVGDWHTHPERSPTPSARDYLTMASRVRLSRHRLAAFLFVIVGQLPPPGGLTVVVHDGTSGYLLTPADTDPTVDPE
jgi:integrative and conjugative element protein (TIGR02256 family)